MMPAIRVENLSKMYRIGAREQRPRTFAQAMCRTAAAPLKYLRAALRPPTQEEIFWALRDISFEVNQGEVVGIIGRNGAGKSTLLKILSRITEPTSGRATIRGRVGSLLEIGTGFHPELTGRENVFLNGTIMGMHRGEIQRKFDEIVDFSGVEKFIDTPVKFYSSGMYVRLAFAVAAHLDSDILIIDEVLAVGDMDFQKKCLGKMDDVSKKQGRTVLFVSHSMAAVQQLCQGGLLLADGSIEMLDKDVEKVISQYTRQAGGKPVEHERLEAIGPCLENEYFSLCRMAMTDERGATLKPPLRNNLDFYFTVEFDLKQKDRGFQIGFAVYDSDNTLLFWSFNTDTAEDAWPGLSLGRNILRARFQKNLLNEGAYSLALLAACFQREWILTPDGNNPCIHFEIRGGLSESPYWYEKRRGVLAPVLRWHAAAKG